MSLLIVIAVRVLEAMFALGMLGSLFVILVSGVEDVETMFDTTDDIPSH
jgi:hypothetical protein